MMAERINVVGRLLRYLDALVFVAFVGALGWLLLTATTRRFCIPGSVHFSRPAPCCWRFLFSSLCGGRRAIIGWPLIVHSVQALVLATPLVFLVFAMDQNMGAHALTRKYTGTEQQTLARLIESGKNKPTKADGSQTFTLLEIARQMKQLDGKRVVTEGLVYRPAIMPPNHLTLFRFAIFCCAADALPVWMFVEHPDVTAFDDENWIRVDGTLTIVNFNGTDVPVIRADTIEKKAAPVTAEQYLFF